MRGIGTIMRVTTVNVRIEWVQERTLYKGCSRWLSAPLPLSFFFASPLPACCHLMYILFLFFCFFQSQVLTIDLCVRVFSLFFLIHFTLLYLYVRSLSGCWWSRGKGGRDIINGPLRVLKGKENVPCKVFSFFSWRIDLTDTSYPYTGILITVLKATRTDMVS